MYRTVITPTYKDHFCFVEKYLKSFDKYLLDREFPIYFIIARDENTDFQKIVSKYKNLNLNVLFFEDILEHFKIKETPKELLLLYGRLSFQTVKKLYGALYIGAEQFLFLDSESMIIKPVNLNFLFDEYFKSPKFFVSKIDNRRKTYNSGFTYEFIRAVTSLMGREPQYYTTESYEWFYELRILKDLIKKLGEPIDIIRNYNMPNTHPNVEGILEAILYYQFLLYNNEYRYKIFITDEEFGIALQENYKDFRMNFLQSVYYECGVLEAFSFFVNKSNVKGFIDFLNKFNFSVCRMEDASNLKNVKYQKMLMENTGVCILASNQGHFLGENSKNLLMYLNKSRKFQQFKGNIFKFINPIKALFNWIFSPFNIVFYLFCTLFSLLSFYIKDDKEDQRYRK